MKSTHRRTWTAPILLAVTSAIGLLSALLADGFGDALSWLLLGIPVAVGAFYSLKRS